MKLMICGSRSIQNSSWVFNHIKDCIKTFNTSTITIIEGEARGVDTIAKLFAKRHNIPIESYPADWDKYGKAAGYIRNEIMVKACDFCLILWDGKSHGTKHDIDLCKKYNKPYLLVVQNGNS